MNGSIPESVCWCGPACVCAGKSHLKDPHVCLCASRFKFQVLIHISRDDAHTQTHTGELKDMLLLFSFPQPHHLPLPLNHFSLLLLPSYFCLYFLNISLDSHFFFLFAPFFLTLPSLLLLLSSSTSLLLPLSHPSPRSMLSSTVDKSEKTSGGVLSSSNNDENNSSPGSGNTGRFALGTLL